MLPISRAENPFRVLNDTMSALRQKPNYSSPICRLTAPESVSHSP
jgi:hypothetical protein